MAEARLGILLTADGMDKVAQQFESTSDVIEAFGKQGALSINVLEQSMKQLSAVIKQTSNPADLIKLKDAYGQLGAKLNELKSQSGLERQLNGVTASARSAHQNLDEISRSVSLFASGNEKAVDTLSNLVFTFERLKGETGGGKAALLALGEAFTGPAGILLGVSTAISLFGPFIEKLFETGEESKKTDELLEELSKTLKDLKSVSDIRIESAGSVEGDITKVQALAAAVKNLNLTTTERTNALNQLKDVNKAYFGDLTLEADKLDTLTDKVNEYTQALIASAVVKGFQDQISKLAPELGKANQALNQSVQKVADLQDKLKNLPEEKQVSVIVAGGTSGASVAQQLSDQGVEHLKIADAINKERGNQEKLSETLQKLRGDYADVLDATNAAVQESLKFKPLQDPTTKAKEGLSELQKNLIDLAKSFSEIFNVPVDLRFSITDTSKQELAKAQAIIKGIEDHTIRLKIIFPDKIEPPKLVPEIDKPEFKKSINDLLQNVQAPLTLLLQPKSFLEQLDDLNRSLNDAFKFDPKNITKSLSDVSKLILTDKEIQDSLSVALKLKIDNKKGQEEFAEAINDIKKFLPDKLVAKLDIALKAGDIDTTGALQAIAKMNDDVSKALQSFAKEAGVDLGSVIGESIGDALSGGDIGKAFEDFGKTLGQAVEALGKQIISLGIAALLAQKALKVLFSNPAVAIAAGVALIAIGKALENLLSGGIPGREKGGPVQAGKPYIVGEKRPELFVPNQSGTIIPYVPDIYNEGYSIAKHTAEKLFNEVHYSTVNNFFHDHSVTNYFDQVNNSPLQKALNVFKSVFNEKSSPKINTEVTNSLQKSFDAVNSIFKEASISDKINAPLKIYTDVVNAVLKQSSSSKENNQLEKAANTLHSVFKESSSHSSEVTREFNSPIQKAVDALNSVFKEKTISVSDVFKKSNTGAISEKSVEKQDYDSTSILLKSSTLLHDVFKVQNNKNSEFSKVIENSSQLLFGTNEYFPTSTSEKEKEKLSISNSFHSAIKDSLKVFNRETSGKESAVSSFREAINEASKIFRIETSSDNKTNSYSFREAIKNVSATFKIIENNISQKSLLLLSEKHNSFTRDISRSLQVVANTFKSSLTSTQHHLNQIFQSGKSQAQTTNNVFTDSAKPTIDFVKVTPFATGGLVFKPTVGFVGEGANINSSNPEVIAPLSDLKKFLPGTGGIDHTVTGELGISGDKLVAFINSVVKSQIRRGGKS